MRSILIPLFCAVLSYILTVSSLPSVKVQGNFVRTRRSESLKSCLDAAADCKKNSSCLQAFRSVKKRCKIKDARCLAAGKDLQKCVDNIDVLIDTAFSAKPMCKCESSQSSLNKILKCQDIYNSVHFNPCYDEGKAVRDNQGKSDTTNVTATTITTTSFMEDESTAIKAEDENKDAGDDVMKTVLRENDAEDFKASEEDLAKLDELFAEDEAKPPKVAGFRRLKATHSKMFSATTTASRKFYFSTTSATKFLDTDSPTTLDITPEMKKALKFSTTGVILIVLGASCFILIFIGILLYLKRRNRRVKYSKAMCTKKRPVPVIYKKDKPSRNHS